MCVCSRAHVCVCARARVRVCVSPGLRRPSPRVATAAVVSLSLSGWYVGVCLCVFVCVRARARVCVLACARVRRARHHGLRRPFPTGPCRPSTGVTTALAASYDGGGRLSLSLGLTGPRVRRTRRSWCVAAWRWVRVWVGTRACIDLFASAGSRGAHVWRPFRSDQITRSTRIPNEIPQNFLPGLPRRESRTTRPTRIPRYQRCKPLRRFQTFEISRRQLTNSYQNFRRSGNHGHRTEFVSYRGPRLELPIF